MSWMPSIDGFAGLMHSPNVSLNATGGSPAAGAAGLLRITNPRLRAHPCYRIAPVRIAEQAGRANLKRIGRTGCQSVNGYGTFRSWNQHDRPWAGCPAGERRIPQLIDPSLWNRLDLDH